MSEQKTVAFFPGKTQLMPVTFNIAVAPFVLYLIGIWPWPPTVWHLGVFGVTTVIAVRYLRTRLARPGLILDEKGIHYGGRSYVDTEIEGVKPYMRALKIRVSQDGNVSEKVINLWWASREDVQAIISLVSQRYKLVE